MPDMPMPPMPTKWMLVSGLWNIASLYRAQGLDGVGDVGVGARAAERARRHRHVGAQRRVAEERAQHLGQLGRRGGRLRQELGGAGVGQLARVDRLVIV